MRFSTYLALLATAAIPTIAIADQKDVGGIGAVRRHVEADSHTLACDASTTADTYSQATAAYGAAADTPVQVATTPSWPGNTTNTQSTPSSTGEASTTDTNPAELTGGALPQPMKASAAGLLGFFIMGLVML